MWYPTWELSRLPGSIGWSQCPLLLLLLLRSWGVPPACLFCSPLASLLCSQDQCSLERSSECIGPGRRAGQTSPVNWAGEMLGTLLPIRVPEGPSRHGNPSPISATPQGCWSCPASTYPLPPSPYILPVRLGVPPVSLGAEVPHQHPAGALVVGKRELHVFPHRHLDSAPECIFKRL